MNYYRLRLIYWLVLTTYRCVCVILHGSVQHIDGLYGLLYSRAKQQQQQKTGTAWKIQIDDCNRVLCTSAHTYTKKAETAKGKDFAMT